MDVGELLSFKPVVNAKRDLEEAPEKPRKVQKQNKYADKSMESDLDTFFGNAKQKVAGENRHKKKGRLQIEKISGEKKVRHQKPETVENPTSSQEEEQNVNEETEEERQMKLLEMWEEKVQQKAGEGADIEEYDDQKVKKLILSFEKKVFRNQEMRIKFPDNPERFMESELDLNDVITEMKTLATMPEQYHYLVELRSVSSLLALLNHANTDISIAVVDLLQELTDVDTITENEEGAEVLIDALMDDQAGALVVQNLERLDESVKEEANGVYNSLSVVENMLEVKPTLGPAFAQQGLLAWLLKRIKAKMPFDSNKLYSSEILSILLQDHDENRQQMGELDGIDILLQQLANFKRHDPKGAEEIEYMENLFNCLCSALLLAANRDRFLNGEGLQLMNLMLREKKMSRNSALKVLDHAMSGKEGANNCSKFVDILGLRTLFPIFMRPPKKNKKIGSSTKDYEEHSVSIVASMLHNLKGSQRQRLIAKFSEGDFAKVDRLLELHFKYYNRIQAVDNRLDIEKARLQQQGEEVDDLEEEFYLRRLESGLFTLQQTDYIIVDICASGTPQVKQRVLQILNLRGGSVKSIRSIIREYAGNMGNDNDSAESDQQRIIALADKF
uniref:Beta-catenin-like protein 1 n=1 Tax=Phallusia mammillata TaxID=59560 RepID=A0A6F9DAZ4_9ASCI|nr:beta-catenin-like protein 1 [Phallusia mammillata]